MTAEHTFLQAERGSGLGGLREPVARVRSPGNKSPPDTSEQLERESRLLEL
jgi:hypothetical protein